MRLRRLAESFGPGMRCKSLTYTKYACAFAPFPEPKSSAIRSCQFNQRFPNYGICLTGLENNSEKNDVESKGLASFFLLLIS
ncbi:MAG: hypothetical protein LUE91_05260 [Oscillospiraceae bacterium]|nr:hypothetical protein [Oscillospiraceae bacterium]